MNNKTRWARRLASACAAVIVSCGTLSLQAEPPGGACSNCSKGSRCAGGSHGKAGWWEETRHFWRDTRHEFHYEYERNARWPQPYSIMAEDAVRQPFAIQADNARLQMVSLWDYHFDPGTGKLNTMGKRRVQDIIDRADSLGQTVYVRRAETQKETELRVSEVNKQIAEFNRDEIPFQVVEAKSSPSSVTGGEAQRALKLLAEPSKSAGTTSGRGGSEGYVGSSSK